MSVFNNRSLRASCYTAAALLLLATKPLLAADFDCSLAATAIEKQICADASLSELDASLGVSQLSVMGAQPANTTLMQSGSIVEKAWVFLSI